MSFSILRDAASVHSMSSWMLLILSSAPGAHAGWVNWVDSSVRDFSITSMSVSQHAMCRPSSDSRQRKNKKAEAVLSGLGFLHGEVSDPAAKRACMLLRAGRWGNAVRLLGRRGRLLVMHALMVFHLRRRRAFHCLLLCL